MARPSVIPESAADTKVPTPSSPSLEAGLYVVSTPIGNLRDITLRALDILGGADLVLAEDTRVARKLLSAYGLAARLASYHEHNAEAMEGRVLSMIAAGESAALISDAGTPLLSDPGARLVQAALAQGLKVIPVPGASALLAALVVSGLPTDQFFFAGFPPAKTGPRREFFAALAAAPATLIFYETGPRLNASLQAMLDALGDRQAAICRELTKLFEEARRGRISALLAELGEPLKGEIVVVVGPPEAAVGPDEGRLDEVLRRLLPVLPIKEAAQRAALETGAPRNLAYRRALAIKDET